ncbi:hypothetical protein niasHT_036918 [Heterodera trifolii]|uniref:Protein kinase domain-containing protein n=1 Tax=Heterodera trifolii TaxID=157864 RepID=A0ABD2IJM3_9BILA
MLLHHGRGQLRLANAVWPTPSWGQLRLSQLRLANSVLGPTPSEPTPSGQLRLANSLFHFQFYGFHFNLGKCIKDKYVVLKHIGQGGFGRVYLCENKYVRGQRYALKMIPMPKGGRHHHSVNPKAEIEIHRDLAKEKGRRFVKILDDFELDGTVFIVMEYCEEGSLKDYVTKHRTPMDILLATDVLIQLTDELRLLHTKKIMHRDLTASNVLIREVSRGQNDDVKRLHVIKILNSREGWTKHSGPDPEAYTRREMKRLMVLAVAGKVAEVKAVGHSTGWEEDEKDWCRLARKLAGTSARWALIEGAREKRAFVRWEVRRLERWAMRTAEEELNAECVAVNGK